MNLCELTISQALEKLRAKEASAREILDSCLARAKQLNPQLQAYLELWEEEARAEAMMIDQARARKEELGPLAGISLALKDNLLIQDREVTSASKILQGHISAYTATAVERLRQAGAIFIGRTNMDEFAMGGSTESSAFGSTKNPWDEERVPGGSSGGSAAAVAADLCLGALGSDTGGSIRQPAALCGVVGLKPTYGRVSRYGLMAMASSLDQIGPISKTVKDAARLLQIIEGDDPQDSTSVVLNETIVPDLIPEDIKGLKIGVPKEYFIPGGMDSDLEQVVRTAVGKLEELGARIKEVSLPHTEFGLAVYYLIMPSEASANLARYDGVRFGWRAPAKSLFELYTQSRGQGFGDEVRRRVMLGTYALSAGYYDAYYKKAQAARTLITNDFREVMKEVDCLVTPTSPMAAFKLGEKFGDPLTIYLCDIFTVSMNLAGVPGLSVPCGFVEKEGKKLPVGLQFIGRHFGESTILRAAHVYEQATEWHKMSPPRL